MRTGWGFEAHVGSVTRRSVEDDFYDRNTFAGGCSANFERHTAPYREPLQREIEPFVRFSFPHVAHPDTPGCPRIHHDLSTVRAQFVRA